MSSPASTAAAAAQRIERIGSHVGHVTVNPTSATAAGTATATAPSAVPVDLVALTDLVLGSKSRAARHNVFQVIASEPALFKYDYNTTKETQREVAWARLKKLNEHGFIRPYAADDFETAHLQNEALNIVDHSVNTLIGAQFVLFAGSIRKLGSETHQEKYLKDAEAMKLRGCFAMTELGHGSNVRGLETTATYDRKTDELVIHTPTETAQKYWIGGGMDAQMATVFAQLIVKGVNYGVHAVLVPLRDPKTNKLLPGVRVKDCGLKQGINGVSNARFWFNNVRVPRENLLNKYGDINAEGDYESLIADNDMRFAATIANLLVGRIGIVSGSTAVSKIGLATAIKYAHTRRQFGPSNAPETPIIEYTTTQLRLLPFLATTYAHSFISRVVAKELHEAQTNGDFQAVKKLHVILSGLKAICSWHCAESLSLAREACGGQGFKTSNRIGFLMGETDVFKTYEGDNMVLLQGLGRDLARQKWDNVAALRGDLELKNVKDEKTLLSAEHQLLLFKLREADLVTKFSELIASNKSDKGEALQMYALLSVDAARAHTERVVLEHFIKVESEQTNVGVKAPLSLLRSLYAIYRLDREPSFLRGQYVSLAKADAISKLNIKLFQEVKKIAIPLVDAFDIPSQFLGEIAGDWVAANAYDAVDNQ